MNAAGRSTPPPARTTSTRCAIATNANCHATRRTQPRPTRPPTHSRPRVVVVARAPPAMVRWKSGPRMAPNRALRAQRRLLGSAKSAHARRAGTDGAPRQAPARTSTRLKRRARSAPRTKAPPHCPSGGESGHHIKTVPRRGFRSGDKRVLADHQNPRCKRREEGYLLTHRFKDLLSVRICASTSFENTHSYLFANLLAPRRSSASCTRPVHPLPTACLQSNPRAHAAASFPVRALRCSWWCL